ncbi:MAG: 3-phosphoshikimate 1-carboxyvinyltransferase [Proteobacteria bacterium]|nr:3-phosphoshikimate 1-carboxyvinyltransferase [Pseudomonadota bacterium]
MSGIECLPGGTVKGSIRVPGDKSISHRAIILSSIAQGTSHISGFLQGEDSLNTLKALQSMGVTIEREGDRVSVHGAGLHGLKKPANTLDMGNSGTAMRLLLGLLAGQSFDATLVGDESLSARPMKRVIEPLQAMGARINSQSGCTAPLTVLGQSKLSPINYHTPMASAQVKSCLLLAALYADGESIIVEPATTRDHTERMLRGFGCPVVSDERQVSISGGQALNAVDIEIPADISSAAFFLVAASIATKSELTLEHVGVNPTRTGVIEILKLMGADITLLNQRDIGGEPVADIVVRSASLHGINIPEALVPLAIDEFPVLFVAAAAAQGKTVFSGIGELRVKESDRIASMADGLRTLGIRVDESADGAVVHGGRFSGGVVASHGDHRVAMSLAIAATIAAGPVTITDTAAVDTSFPGFVDCLADLGVQIETDA